MATLDRLNARVAAVLAAANLAHPGVRHAPSSDGVLIHVLPQGTPVCRPGRRGLVVPPGGPNAGAVRAALVAAGLPALVVAAGTVYVAA
jgi:hypothetical protein